MAAGVTPKFEGQDTVKVIALRGSNPGLTLQSLPRLRIINPAPTSRTSAIAIVRPRRALQPLARAARPAAALFQCSVQAGAGAFQRGREAKEDSGDYGAAK